MRVVEDPDEVFATELVEGAQHPAITISPISPARTRRPWRGTVTPYAGAR